MADSLRPIYVAVPADSSKRIELEASGVAFDHEYGRGDGTATRMFAKSVSRQWNSLSRLNWAQELDPLNPLEFDDRFIPIFGSPAWKGIGKERRAVVRMRYQAFVVSQFLHGEQAALIAAGKLVEAASSVADKKLAAMQAADEARHVDIFERLLQDKIGTAYPLDPNLGQLIERGLADRRIDYVMLTTQILIEGFALAAFQHMRDVSKNSLIQSLAAYVIEDEARHVAFGVDMLVNVIPTLSEAERREREQFILASLEAFRARLDPAVVWESAELDSKACSTYIRGSRSAALMFRRLMRRVLPLLQRIGLFSDPMKRELSLLGLVPPPHVNIDIWLQADEEIAQALESGA